MADPVGDTLGAVSLALLAADSPPTPSSNVPYRRDPDFIERSDITAQITAALEAPAARVAFVGLGGVGYVAYPSSSAWRLC
jgi:hypothetical protein